MLRHKRLRIDHARGNCVSKSLLKGLADPREGASLVVAPQVLHIFENKCCRSVSGNDVSDVEEKVPLLEATEPVRSAEGILLRDTSDGERLTRKASQQQIVPRNRLWIDRSDVIGERMIRSVGEVRHV